MALEDWKGVTIKVIGVGGAGCNAVDRMIQIGIPGVEFIAANSDAQALSRCEAPCKIQLGAGIIRPLGAGGDPAIGARAAYESREAIARALRGADMVFITAGMGGGVGTGATPIVAQIARAEGALTIAVVTKPFSFEGNRRLAIAEEGIVCLRDQVDTLIVISNDRLLNLVEKRTSLDLAFRVADEVLRQGVQGISELVLRPGLINLDFADVRALMAHAGGALVSIGRGEGEKRAVEAAQAALQSPLLNIQAIHNTEGLLVNITGGEDLTLHEVNQAMEILSQVARPHSTILFGAVIDQRMAGRIEITVIATGVAVEGPAPVDSAGITVPLTAPRDEQVTLADIFGDELAVPAFMRSPRRARIEELVACVS